MLPYGIAPAALMCMERVDSIISDGWNGFGCSCSDAVITGGSELPRQNNGSISSRDFIQGTLDKLISKIPIGGTLTTDKVYSELSSRKRGITNRTVAIHMRERYDLEWISPGKWERVEIPIPKQKL